jgi:hypothetical protein
MGGHLQAKATKPISARTLMGRYNGTLLMSSRGTIYNFFRTKNVWQEVDLTLPIAGMDPSFVPTCLLVAVMRPAGRELPLSTDLPNGVFAEGFDDLQFEAYLTVPICNMQQVAMVKHFLGEL